MSDQWRMPFDINDVPDRILGTRRITRTPTGEVITLPGGNQAGVTQERTDPIPTSSQCPPDPFAKNLSTVQRLPHVEPSWESDFTHVQTPAPVIILGGATVDVALFTVPDNLTLFVEKLFMQPAGMDYSTLRFGPIVNSLNVFELNPNPGIHWPTLPQSQQNIRLQVDSGQTMGLRFTNTDPDVQKIITAAGWIGWLVNQSCAELNMRAKAC